jgi:S-DNA-T family DNA segregation ATPase FtsK/SpoIIIE
MLEPPAVSKAEQLLSPKAGRHVTFQKETGYTLPSLELLSVYDTSLLRPSKDELFANSSLLESKLLDFDVQGKITRVHPGPVVTLYEFEPAPGVKINRVVTLADDLTLALRAQSTRVSPIPGKATIGIEVPNKQREVVSLREIISSEGFSNSPSKLTLALGKDIFGTPVVADLAKMPHLLVAGATGAGKSVSINSMVMSILYKASPAEVKLMMIDPKLLELSMYEDIPHLISPVITNPKKAAEALKKMVFEMERRYRLLAEKGSRNIESFNQQSSEEEKIPYIIIFIDELADLMFASSNEVEDSITRLAQMARAAGIHLIIATQRPSVDVITGLIKANFPARISFQVFSKIDSRTILDSQGAEQLLGKGDMLLMLPGSRIIRVHGALITEDEITAVTAFIKSQGRPDYSIFEDIPAEAPVTEEAAQERDEMYYKAVEFAESVGEVSISSLQRRFKIGYNRAARIMEIMEDDRLVGPPKGAGKPRDFIGRHN